MALGARDRFLGAYGGYQGLAEQLGGSQALETTDFLYVRLIGDRKAVEKRTDHFDKIVIDQTERLRGWNALLRKMLERVPDIYAYANNHFAGHAPATIDTLRDMIDH